MSPVSVKALEPFPLVSPLVIGLRSCISGWQSYLGLGLSRSLIMYVCYCLAPLIFPNPCALGQQVIAGIVLHCHSDYLIIMRTD